MTQSVIIENLPEPIMKSASKDVSMLAASEQAPASFTVQIEATIDVQPLYAALQESISAHGEAEARWQRALWNEGSFQRFAAAEAKLQEAYREIARLYAERMAWVSVDNGPGPGPAIGC